MNETQERLLDVAIDVLGRNPDAGMGEIASAAGVVRRTVYGHFPSRTDLVRALAERAVDEVATVLTEVDAPNGDPDVVWVDVVARLWPLAHRYRVLLVLRRGEHSAMIHGLLGPVDSTLADLVARGQAAGTFGRHLPPAALSQLAYGAVFTVADDALTDPALDARAATITSLLILGVPEARASALVGGAR